MRPRAMPAVGTQVRPGHREPVLLFGNGRQQARGWGAALAPGMGGPISPTQA